MRVRVMAQLVGPWGLQMRELFLPTCNSSLRGYCVPVMRAPFTAAAIKRKAAMVRHFRKMIIGAVIARGEADFSFIDTCQHI